MSSRFSWSARNVRRTSFDARARRSLVGGRSSPASKPSPHDGRQGTAHRARMERDQERRLTTMVSGMGRATRHHMHPSTPRLAALILACSSCASSNNSSTSCDCASSDDTVAVSPSETATVTVDSGPCTAQPCYTSTGAGGVGGAPAAGPCTIFPLKARGPGTCLARATFASGAAVTRSFVFTARVGCCAPGLDVTPTSWSPSPP